MTSWKECPLTCRPYIPRTMHAPHLYQMVRLEQRTSSSTFEMCDHQSSGAWAKENRALFPFPAYQYGPSGKINIFRSDSHEFTDTAARRV